MCSAGPARVQQVIREALARGADRGVHVDGAALASADGFTVAAALADAMRDEAFDLVLTGLQSDDHGHAQTGVALAELLGIPHSTIIMNVEVGDGRVRVKRELEGGWFQWVSMPTPALLTIQSGINQLRYAAQGHPGGQKKRKFAASRRRAQAGEEDSRPVAAVEIRNGRHSSPARRLKRRRSRPAAPRRRPAR